MTKRIEWIEPEEVTHLRREDHQKSRHEVRQMSDLFLRGGILLIIPALLPAILGLDYGQSFRHIMAGLAMPIALSLLLRLFLHLLLSSEPRERIYALDTADRQLWKHARSFEISDFPDLPGIRRLLINGDTAARQVQFNFRVGQLNEAELSTFVESQIANARTERLMRRVKL